MESINDTIEVATRFLPVLATLAAVTAILYATNWYLRRRWHENPDAQFRFQLIMLSLTFAGILGVIIALPINDTLRGQLLSLIGILLSAAIALSSTTFIGNVMAGIMLKVVKSARPGDFITVADLTGRITEMDLLHTEIQTEFRDLVTVPNLYLVTQPVQVVRASGTIIFAEVSLGYDIPHGRVREILCRAGEAAGLKDCFANVRELGDFSITYRIAGLLENVQSLITARSQLRTAVLDALHGEGIEIVSPNFMNTRALPEGQLFVPRVSADDAPQQETTAEDVAFDKADEAASIEEIRKAIEAADREMAELEEQGIAADKGRLAGIEARKLRLIDRLKAAEEQKQAEEALD